MNAQIDRRINSKSEKRKDSCSLFAFMEMSTSKPVLSNFKLQSSVSFFGTSALFLPKKKKTKTKTNKKIKKKKTTTTKKKTIETKFTQLMHHRGHTTQQRRKQASPPLNPRCLVEMVEQKFYKIVVSSDRSEL